MTYRGTVVCDLDGVVYLGDEMIPGADRAITAMLASGWQVVFCTNNATRTPEQIATKLAGVSGLVVDPSATVSSAQAAAALVAGRITSAFVLGAEGIHAALAHEGVSVTSDFRRAEAVVVGLDPEISYAKLRDAALAIQSGAWFVATNLDPAYPTPDGLWPGAGAIVAAVSVTVGQDAEPAGKPYQPMIDLLRSRMPGDGPVVVVGDRPSTDLAMGKSAGWLTAGVLTGVVSRPAEVPEHLIPDVMLDSLADLPVWLRDHVERKME